MSRVEVVKVAATTKQNRYNTEMSGSAELLGMSDVVVLRWPQEEPDRERLAEEGRPRLLLLEPDVDPPDGGDCSEDWIRLPADDRDVAARLAALSARAARHRPVPHADDQGRLLHRGRWVALSPIEHRLVRELAIHFGTVVTGDQLARAAWPNGGASRGALRIHLSRLRRRIDPLGLEIGTVRSFGHVLEERVPVEPSG
jgi:hypothetical protein